MILTRQFENKYGTFGILEMNDGSKFHTVECQYHSNQRFFSCVPPGEYKLVPHRSKKFGDVVALVNEDLNVYHYEHDQGRYAILMHTANTEEELSGCIAPGRDLGVVNGRWAVTDSRSAMGRIRPYFETDKRILIK